MPRLHPPRLIEGDRVALVSPAGPLPEPECAERAASALKDLGFRAVVGKHAGGRFDYLAGTDQDRAADLNSAIRDPEIKAVLCTRGGYGSGRLLPSIDYETLRQNPKIIAGFSDITSLHGAFSAAIGLCTLHSPTIYAAYVDESALIDDDSHLLHVHHLTSNEPAGSLRQRMNWNTPQVLRQGKAAGRLVGGNLSVFASLCGTSWMPSPEGAVLFLEDVGEEPYRLDRMLNQLALCGYLGTVEAILLGQFTNCNTDDPKRGTVTDMLARVLEPLSVPIIANLPTGHERRNASLPMGCAVEVDADTGDVIFTEALAR